MTSLQQQRIDLACALRWAARLGLQEGVCNHFSLAVADEDGIVRGDRFLINPYGLHWSEITASSLVLCDAEGNVLEGEHEVEPTAFFIHSRIHRAAPQAVCVLHTHMPYATALTLRAGGRLAMCEQNALMFHGRIAYDDDYNGLALDGSEGDRIARKLGNGSVLFLASHGVIVTGRTVAEAFTDLYYLECAARAQVLAASGGHALRTISEGVQRRTAQQHMQEFPGLAERLFGAYRRMLDREEPDYRT
ncbi:aldolase [Benzoatithermus flavus]|uniref:Aldolase n=1 Tax=Benzoatithermus flavus TaxID=3108223 RepID=A0ABU8XKG0_9PROT